MGSNPAAPTNLFLDIPAKFSFFLTGTAGISSGVLVLLRRSITFKLTAAERDASMRFKNPFSALLKGQRRWRKLVKDTFPLIGLADQPKATPKAREKRAAPSRTALVRGPRLREQSWTLAHAGIRAAAEAGTTISRGCAARLPANGRQYDKGSGWSRMAREKGFVLLYPEQTKQNNQNLCFNWFRPSSVARDRGELMSIRQMIEHAARRHNIPHSRIFLQGLSAGGAMAGALLATYPDLFAAGQIVGGCPMARRVMRCRPSM